MTMRKIRSMNENQRRQFIARVKIVLSNDLVIVAGVILLLTIGSMFCE
jgi:hypothetical protein